jgi:hypothetical protein
MTAVMVYEVAECTLLSVEGTSAVIIMQFLEMYAEMVCNSVIRWCFVKDYNELFD